VLVPWRGAADDHQSDNARAFAVAGAAVHVPERDCNVAHLDALLRELLDDAARLAAMSDAARTLARPDAAADVAALVERAAA
jgi:UDP-N-acetylglucosamine--N-acetylmuramyl-(pentapeptide) pyrophosphoryl-undecaprenol N-acetylglucosamine transferase